jgi:molybdopterin-synthase adenylyltransferase
MDEERLLTAMRAMAREESCEGGPPLPTLSEKQLVDLASESGIGLRQVQMLALDNGITPARYLRNYRQLSLADQKKLLSSRVALVGLGGLGGHLLEWLARMGVGRIDAVDGDRFEECNLNRQLLCSERTMGMSKSEAARLRAVEINPAVEIEAVPMMLDERGFSSLVERSDLVFDALGGVRVKRMLLGAALNAGVPVVTAAVAGWTCMVTTVLPGHTPFPDLFGESEGAEVRLGCLAPVIGMAAAAQCSEGIRVLCGKGASLSGRMLVADLAQASFELFEI